MKVDSIKSFEFYHSKLFFSFRFCRSNKMGKIKRERPKFHIAAVKKDDETKSEKNATLTFKPQLNSMQNIFAGINIQISNINKLDDISKPEQMHNEEASTETALETALKSTKTKNEDRSENKHLTKKEKLALKHRKLMEKLDATHKVKVELQKRQQKQKRTRNIDEQDSLKTQGPCSMLTSAATKSSNQNINEQTAKNVFFVPTFNDDLPPLNNVLESRKDVLCLQTKLKKKHGKKDFAKNYNFLKKSMAKKMK